MAGNLHRVHCMQFTSVLQRSSPSFILRRSFSQSTRSMAPLSAVHVVAATPKWSTWRLNPASATPVTSRMLKNQSQLPKLPVPALDVTLAKVLKSCRAVAKSESEYAALEKSAVEFAGVGGLGRALQERLEAKRNDPACRNWIAEDWDMDCYMKYRDSVVVNVSYYCQSAE